MAESAVKLVCLDLGRVLVRICDGWGQACALAGVAAPAGGADGAAWAELERIVELNETGRIDTAEFCRQTAPLVGLTPRQVRAISDAWLREPYAGAAELIEDLARRPIASACLSNTNDNHWALMHAAGGRSYLPLQRLTHRFASHLIGWMKPAAEVYAHVERATGLPPEAILFFDDDPRNVEAARGRGWRVEPIAPGGDPVAQVRCALVRYHVL